MWRGLYHDHYLLGAKKDTMPRRRWFKVISGATLSSLFASSSSQQISPTAIGAILAVPVIDDVGFLSVSQSPAPSQSHLFPHPLTFKAPHFEVAIIGFVDKGFL